VVIIQHMVWPTLQPPPVMPAGLGPQPPTPLARPPPPRPAQSVDLERLFGPAAGAGAAAQVPQPRPPVPAGPVLTVEELERHVRAGMQ